MLDYDWEESVGYWLCMTSHELRKAMAPLLSEHGLTLRHWEVLACLSRRGCSSQAELAEFLSIEPNTLAGVLKRMQLAGLLERRSCAEDRRKKGLYPTQAAEELWQRATAITRRIRAEATAGLSEADLQQLKTTCAKIRDNLSRMKLPEAFEAKAS